MGTHGQDASRVARSGHQRCTLDGAEAKHQEHLNKMDCIMVQHMIEARPGKTRNGKACCVR